MPGMDFHIGTCKSDRYVQRSIHGVERRKQGILEELVYYGLQSYYAHRRK